MLVLRPLPPTKLAAIFKRQRLLAKLFCGFPILLLGFGSVARAELEPGEISLAEMNCIACHRASPGIEKRLESRKAPLLGTNGLRLSPTWVQDFLLDPQREKPGTVMPDMLHGLSASDKAEATEDLTQYLVSLQPVKTNEEIMFDSSAAKEGGEVFHKVGCVACHAPQELPTGTDAESYHKSDLLELSANSVSLGNLAKKFTVEELAAFLVDPLNARPAGRMPAQRLSDLEAYSVAMYLLRDQPSAASSVKVAGLRVEYFGGNGDKMPDFTKLTMVSNGYATNFMIAASMRKNSRRLRFSGVLIVPRPGDYTFWTEATDGAQLFIDNQEVGDTEDKDKPVEHEGKVKLTAGDHTIGVTYFRKGDDGELKVSWAGPELDKQQIPGAALHLAADAKLMRFAGEQPFVPDSVKAAKGRQLFSQYNCAVCHDLGQPGRRAAPLDQLAGSQKGCLALTPPDDAPNFALTELQRHELVILLNKVSNLDTPLSPADQIHRTMTVLNCYACHNRDGQGSPSGLRRAYFKANIGADLGDEGAIPPSLNGVGAKLKPQWLEKVLFDGASVRPYMATRMPQFGRTNVQSLITAFEQADAPLRSGTNLVIDPDYANGLRLVGSGGLNCIACHVFAGHPSLGVPAIDLTTAPERLFGDWFRRYLLDPAKLRPGTRMPSFWPDGVAANKSILNGNTEQQIDAIWSYLNSGKTATDLPPGLISAKMELTPKQEPLIYRNFIKGAGSRAIGVGYPGKVNLAFDANQICVALLWRGAFIDASRHRTGRGEGFEPPLGFDIAELPSGPAFAVLANANTPWPKAFGKAANYQFRGYVYDEQRHPHFRYQFRKIDIEDYFLPSRFADKGEFGFRRSVTLHKKKYMANLWFRAAVANTLDDLGNHTYLVDGRVRLAFPSSFGCGEESDVPPSSKIVMRTSGDKRELLVPVTFKSGEANIIEEISW